MVIKVTEILNMSNPYAHYILYFVPQMICCVPNEHSWSWLSAVFRDWDLLFLRSLRSHQEKAEMLEWCATAITEQQLEMLAVDLWRLYLLLVLIPLTDGPWVQADHQPGPTSRGDRLLSYTYSEPGLTPSQNQQAAKQELQGSKTYHEQGQTICRKGQCISNTFILSVLWRATAIGS
jgi:hypothetical protein